MTISPAHLRILLSAATPGEWHCDSHFASPWISSGHFGMRRDVFKCGSRADADLIMALVNAAPQLLAVLEAACRLRDVCRARGEASVPAAAHKRAKLALLAAVDAATRGDK